MKVSRNEDENNLIQEMQGSVLKLVTLLCENNFCERGLRGENILASVSKTRETSEKLVLIAQAVMKFNACVLRSRLAETLRTFDRYSFYEGSSLPSCASNWFIAGYKFIEEFNDELYFAS